MKDKHSIIFSRCAPVSLPEMFFLQAEHFANEQKLFARMERHHAPPIALNWTEAAALARSVADTLIAEQIAPQERVVLLSENRPEWGVCHVGIMAAGALSVPLYVTSTPEEWRFIVQNSGARAAVISRAMVEKFLPIARAHALAAVIVLGAETGEQEAHAEGAPARAEETPRLHFLRTPRAHAPEAEQISAQKRIAERVSQRMAACKTEHCACIIYTSGTSGTPRGVMLSHANLFANIRAACSIVGQVKGFSPANERFLSFLPLSHSYEHMAGLLFPIALGAEIHYARALETLLQDIGRVRPTLMTAVPRLYEVIHARMKQAQKSMPPLRRAILNQLLALGRKSKRGEKLSLLETLFTVSLGARVRAKTAKRFGGRLRAFISGGAPLNVEIANDFEALGLCILQGYGQTEAAPLISVNRPGSVRNDTVGPAVSGVDIRIAKDGEILVRGPNVMLGYWQNPQETDSVLREGWLHTGDVGALDEEGFLKITDRKKDIIVNSGGDNIAPQRVEGIVLLEPEIAQAMVAGDRQAHLAALIVPDQEFVSKWCADHKIAGTPSFQTLWKHEEFRRTLNLAVERANEKLSVIEKIRRFALADEAFTVENGMLTPSLKIRRMRIHQHYDARIASLFGAKGA